MSGRPDSPRDDRSEPSEDRTKESVASERDDRLPRIRVTENQNHMTKCSTCQSNFDTRFFIMCPYCEIQNARKRRALDTILPVVPLLGDA